MKSAVNGQASHHEVVRHAGASRCRRPSRLSAARRWRLLHESEDFTIAGVHPVPLAFVLSTLLGVVGSAIANGGVLFVWSGVTFGLAFVALGCQMWNLSND